MSRYESFPIYDMKSGLVLAKEPWLLPQDAFQTLEDCYLRQGVLMKRHGYTPFAQFVHIVASAFGAGIFGAGRFGMGRVTATPGNPIMGIWPYYKENVETLLAMDTEKAGKYNPGTSRCDDLIVLKLRFKNGEAEIVTNDIITGALSGDTAIVVAVVLDNGAWADGDASGTLIVTSATEGDFQVENLTVNDSTAAVAAGAASYEDFSGDDSDFFWLCNWRNVGYLTNNHDQVQKYDGSYLTKLNIDLDVEGGPDNDVNTCLLIFAMHAHLILLGTVERGSAHYQRCRWSMVKAPGTWRDDDYVDAPTDDYIVAAEFVGSDLIVWFERSEWKLVYTSDPDLPFRWELIARREGCAAKMSLAPIGDEIYGIGPTHVLGTDGRDFYQIDEKIPDLMLSFNLNKVYYSFALVVEEMRQIMLSYCSPGAERPDRALVLNYEERSFATYNLPIHVMGKSSLTETIALDDMVGISLDDLDYSLDDKELRAGYPTTLMGCRDGWLYKLNDGGADDGEPIEFKAVGGRWNPYIKQGRKARLGWVDFLIDNNGASFTVFFYINSQSGSYKSQLVSCSEDSSAEKIWVRANCGAVGATHEVKLYNKAKANRPIIHAVVPFFKRAGNII